MDASFALLVPEVPTSSPQMIARRSMAPASRPRALDELQLTEIRRYDARQTIFAAGDAARLVHEVVDGVAMVSQRLPDGRRQVLDIVGAGRLLGLGSGPRHDCSAESLTACVVRGYQRAGVETSPRTHARVLQAMALDVRRMRQHLSINGRKFAVERVAAFLESLVGQSASTPIIEVPLSRGELAEYIGLTLETTSRCFARLKRLKVLGKEHGDLVHVLDWPRLRQLARGVGVED